MDVTLNVLGGSGAGKQLLIAQPRFLIGRAEDCHLRPKSDLVSRHHCALLIDGEVFLVRDLGSRNGTFVNDVRVDGEQELKAGDRLQVGPLAFEVGIVPSKKRAKVNSIAEAAVRTAEGAPSDTEFDIDEMMGDQPTLVPTADTRELRSEQSHQDTVPVPASAQRAVAALAEPAPAPAPVPVAAAVTIAPDTVTPVPASVSETVTPDKKPSAPPKPAGNDSGQAAADVLRAFFRRR